MKVFLIGKTDQNAGPANVTKEIIRNSDGRMMHTHYSNNKLLAVEIFFKSFFTDVFIISGIIRWPVVKFIRKFHKPIIYIMHGCLDYEDDINHLHAMPIEHVSEKYILDNVDKILCVSELYSEWVKNRFPQYKEKISFLDNGLDIEPRKRVTKITHSVAVAGGNRQIKNNSEVCKAIELLNKQGFDCTLSIFGWRYPDGENLTAYPHCKYMGQLDKKEYYSLLDKNALFVINSEIEPFGLITGDALNCHCSILFSKHVGSSGIVRTEDCDFIEDQHNPERIAVSIRYCLEHSNADRLLDSVDVHKCSGAFQYQKLMNICKKMIIK